MSTVVHVGPPLGQQGGPSGYFAQLAKAFSRYGTGGHHVVLPRGEAAAARSSAPAANGLLTFIRRARLTYIGRPRFARPSSSEAASPGGPLAHLIETSWQDVQATAAAALADANVRTADVLFAHDAPTAERALETRQTGQQVWLLLHTPMPLALYLAWCWGMPDCEWNDVARFPDVEAGMARELRAIEAVDRVFIPCREAVDELTRISPAFGPALSRVEFLMTGGQSPARRRAGLQPAALRRSFGLPDDQPIALFLGNAQPYRGLDALLAAARHLAQRTSRGVVAVAGPRPDTLPLAPRMIALGPVADVSDLLAAVDVVINVNRFSLFDLSTIEALEAGKPLLLHAVGGNRTFEQLGAGCRMVSDLSPETIADGLAELLSSETLRAQMAEQSRECWMRHLTPQHLRDRHVHAYEHVTEPTGRPLPTA